MARRKKSKSKWTRRPSHPRIFRFSNKKECLLNKLTNNKNSSVLVPLWQKGILNLQNINRTNKQIHCCFFYIREKPGRCILMENLKYISQNWTSSLGFCLFSSFFFFFFELLTVPFIERTVWLICLKSMLQEFPLLLSISFFFF